MSLTSPFKYLFVNERSNTGERVDVLSIQENSKLGKMTEDGNRSFLNVHSIFQTMLPVPSRRWIGRETPPLSGCQARGGGMSISDDCKFTLRTPGIELRIGSRHEPTTTQGNQRFNPQRS